MSGCQNNGSLFVSSVRFDNSHSKDGTFFATFLRFHNLTFKRTVYSLVASISLKKFPTEDSPTVVFFNICKVQFDSAQNGINFFLSFTTKQKIDRNLQWWSGPLFTLFTHVVTLYSNARNNGTIRGIKLETSITLATWYIIWFSLTHGRIDFLIFYWNYYNILRKCSLLASRFFGIKIYLSVESTSFYFLVKFSLPFV